jgi:hypothetical protein
VGLKSVKSKRQKTLARHPISRAMKRVSTLSERERKIKKSWAVFVESPKGLSNSAMFRSGSQYFAIGYPCTPDEGGKAKARWFVKMFLNALKNMGVDIRKRQRR